MPKTTTAEGWPTSQFVRTRAKVASFFGVSDTTITNWLNRGMPAATDAGWDLWAIIRWRVEQAQTSTEQSQEMRVIELRKATAQAEKAEMEVAAAKGLLVPLDTIKAEQADQNHKIRQRLIAIPGEIVSAVPGSLRDEIGSIAKEKIRLALKDLKVNGDSP